MAENKVFSTILPKTDNKLQEYYKEFGATVKKYRQAGNLTLEELGLLIGLDPASVHNLEKGRNVTVLTIIKIALALKKEPADFFKIPFLFNDSDLEYLHKNKK